MCAFGTLQCLDGEVQCIPEMEPGPEICDGLDNDCDGTADDYATACGVGECAATGWCSPRVTVEIIDMAAFKQRFGFSMRIGVGGLWGQFGYSYTRIGLVDTYFSTMGPWLLLQLRSGRPLLVSPERLEDAKRALGF